MCRAPAPVDTLARTTQHHDSIGRQLTSARSPSCQRQDTSIWAIASVRLEDLRSCWAALAALLYLQSQHESPTEKDTWQVSSAGWKKHRLDNVSVTRNVAREKSANVDWQRQPLSLLLQRNDASDAERLIGSFLIPGRVKLQPFLPLKERPCATGQRTRDTSKWRCRESFWMFLTSGCCTLFADMSLLKGKHSAWCSVAGG